MEDWFRLTDVVAIVAIIVTALTSMLLTKRTLRADVSSKSRIAWVEKLRELVSEFLMLTDPDVGHDDRDPRRRTQLIFQIELMLNPVEDAHSQARGTMVELALASGKYVQSSKKELLAMQSAVMESVQTVIKDAWEQAKALR